MAHLYGQDEWVVEGGEDEDEMEEEEEAMVNEEIDEEVCYKCSEGGGMVLLCDYCSRAAHPACSGLKVGK